MNKVPEHKLQKHLFFYDYNGDSYSLHIDAYSEEEAVGRVRSIFNAQYAGVIKAEIPLNPRKYNPLLSLVFVLMLILFAVLLKIYSL